VKSTVLRATSRRGTLGVGSPALSSSTCLEAPLAHSISGVDERPARRARGERVLGHGPMVNILTTCQGQAPRSRSLPPGVPLPRISARRPGANHEHGHEAWWSTVVETLPNNLCCGSPAVRRDDDPAGCPSLCAAADLVGVIAPSSSDSPRRRGLRGATAGLVRPRAPACCASVSSDEKVIAHSRSRRRAVANGDDRSASRISCGGGFDYGETASEARDPRASFTHGPDEQRIAPRDLELTRSELDTETRPREGQF